MAPECDVSIRPGWFYHPGEESKNRAPENLLALYEKSVGRNSLLLLNVPPDRRGHLTDGEIASLQGFDVLRQRVYGRSLAASAKLSASSTLGIHSVENLVSVGGFWAPEVSDLKPGFVAEFAEPATFDRVILGEAIAEGQRVRKFSVEARVDGRWKVIGEGTTIGRKRILPTSRVTADAIRVTITDSRSTPALKLFGVYFRG